MDHLLKSLGLILFIVGLLIPPALNQGLVGNEVSPAAWLAVAFVAFVLGLVVIITVRKWKKRLTSLPPAL